MVRQMDLGAKGKMDNTVDGSKVEATTNTESLISKEEQRGDDADEVKKTR